MDLYLIFQFVKGLCHGNQIILPNEGKLILYLFFGRSLDGHMVLFRYYLLGGDTAALSGLLARLCHVFIVYLFFYKLFQYLQDRFSRFFHQMEGICVNFLDPVQFFRLTLQWQPIMWQNYLTPCTGIPRWKEISLPQYAH